LRQSFGLFVEADAIDKATAATMEAGFLTADLGGTTSTTDFTKEVLKQIEGGE
ncbi:3-isopropylmalate dehydrogenase, partial [Listeria welshimeri]|nr:3-isopropylmalate dehydrogenase [Listeria welshimeri]